MKIKPHLIIALILSWGGFFSWIYFSWTAGHIHPWDYYSAGEWISSLISCAGILIIMISYVYWKKKKRNPLSEKDVDDIFSKMKEKFPRDSFTKVDIDDVRKENEN